MRPPPPAAGRRTSPERRRGSRRAGAGGTALEMGLDGHLGGSVQHAVGEAGDVAARLPATQMLRPACTPALAGLRHRGEEDELEPTARRAAPEELVDAEQELERGTAPHGGSVRGVAPEANRDHAAALCGEGGEGGHGSRGRPAGLRRSIGWHRACGFALGGPGYDEVVVPAGSIGAADDVFGRPDLADRIDQDAEAVVLRAAAAALAKSPPATSARSRFPRRTAPAVVATPGRRGCGGATRRMASRFARSMRARPRPRRPAMGRSSNGRLAPPGLASRNRHAVCADLHARSTFRALACLTLTMTPTGEGAPAVTAAQEPSP